MKRDVIQRGEKGFPSQSFTHCTPAVTVSATNSPVSMQAQMLTLQQKAQTVSSGSLNQ